MNGLKLEEVTDARQKRKTTKEQHVAAIYPAELNCE